MKKLSGLFLFVILCSFSVFAFSKGEVLKQSAMSAIWKSHLMNASPDMATVFKPSATHWAWDTIVTTLSTGQQSRYTRTYDNLGRALTQISEYLQGSSWDPERRTSYVYDSQGNIVNTLFDEWSLGSWASVSRSIVTYNSDWNMVELLDEDFDGTVWTGSFKKIFTYDSSGHLLTETWEVWSSGAWVFNRVYTYTWDAAGRMAEDRLSLWNINSWIDVTRDSYSYDANGNTVTMVSEKWQDNAWVYTHRNHYSYDGSGNLLTLNVMVWQNGTWVQLNMSTISYDLSGRLLDVVYSDWSPADTMFLVTSKYTNSYDSSGNMVQYLSQDWDSTGTGTWINLARRTYTYDSYGNSTNGEYEVWNGNNWVSEDLNLDLYIEQIPQEDVFNILGSEYTYQASFISKLNGLISKTSLTSLKICPNPASDKITIECNPFPTKDLPVIIYNEMGLPVLQEKMSNSKTQFDISKLPAGFYIVKLNDGKTTSAVRLIKQ